MDESTAAAAPSGPSDHLTTEYFLYVIFGWLAYGICVYVVANIILPRCRFPGNTPAQRYWIGIDVLSTFFSIYIFALGFTSLLNLDGDFMHATYMPIVVDGVRLGMTYLSIDLVLTFIAHSAEENARNLPLSGRVKSFLRAHSLFVLHHVVTGGFILPLGMWIYDKGHIVFTTIALHEASTPFLNIYRIMKKMDMAEHKFFLANGILFVIAFFIFRICAFPFMYWRYLRWRGASNTWEEISSLPWYCHIGSLSFFLIQSYWFGKIVSRLLRRAARKKSREE